MSDSSEQRGYAVVPGPIKPRVHELKTWPEYFDAVIQGVKRFEVRKDDRGYMVGDVLVLKEYDPAKRVVDEGIYIAGVQCYTGRQVRMRVTYKLPGGKCGIDARYCVLGIASIDGAGG